MRQVAHRAEKEADLNTSGSSFKSMPHINYYH